MPTLLSEYPETEELALGVASALEHEGIASGPVTVLDRQRNPYSSTFASEIARCQLADGKILQLFCKYGAAQGYDRYGHRGEMTYESKLW